MPHRLAPQVLHRLEFVFGILHRPPPQQAPQVLCRRGRFVPSSPSTSAGTAGALLSWKVSTIIALHLRAGTAGALLVWKVSVACPTPQTSGIHMPPQHGAPRAAPPGSWPGVSLPLQLGHLGWTAMHPLFPLGFSTWRRWGWRWRVRREGRRRRRA